MPATGVGDRWDGKYKWRRFNQWLPGAKEAGSLEVEVVIDADTRAWAMGKQIGREWYRDTKTGRIMWAHAAAACTCHMCHCMGACNNSSCVACPM